MRYGRIGQRDANEPEIVRALTDFGARVWRLHEPFDLLVAHEGTWFALEVKPPGRLARADQRRQRLAQTSIDAPIPIVTSPAEALAAIAKAE